MLLAHQATHCLTQCHHIHGAQVRAVALDTIAKVVKGAGAEQVGAHAPSSFLQIAGNSNHSRPRISVCMA